MASTNNLELIRSRLQAIEEKFKLQPRQLASKFPHVFSPVEYKWKVEAEPIQFQSYIDHTLLKPTATSKEIEQLCEEAKKNNFKAVCVQPGRAEEALRLLLGTNVKVATVVGFPLGATTINQKAYETASLAKLGVHEIDMVINLGRLKDGDWNYVFQEIKAVVAEATPFNAIVKVILETGALKEEEIIDASLLSVLAGAAFVKTSTGFNFPGADEKVVRLMKQCVGDLASVKASGGVRSSKDALVMIRAGAARIGTSSGVTIVQGETSKEGY